MHYYYYRQEASSFLHIIIDKWIFWCIVLILLDKHIKAELLKSMFARKIDIYFSSGCICFSNTFKNHYQRKCSCTYCEDVPIWKILFCTDEFLIKILEYFIMFCFNEVVADVSYSKIMMLFILFLKWNAFVIENASKRFWFSFNSQTISFPFAY